MYQNSYSDHSNINAPGHTARTNTFDIRNYSDRLEPTKSKDKYICPGCGGNNLSINPRNGAYQCFNGCETKDIREAIAPRRNRDEFEPDEFDRKIAQKKLENELKNERKRERELKLETEKLSKALNPIDRDTEHRKILSQLTLSDEHRDYLVNRVGFPLEALERCRTVEPKQRLTYQINKNLAGINPNSGMTLTNGEKGILVAFPDANGYLVGMKLYNPNAKETGGAKSKWFSSDWFDKGCSPKLPNGEQPIAVYYPVIITDLTKIGLGEGVECKPQEAANRLGYPVIGFSGISFLNSSPETTKAAIATIQAKTGINNDVELIPIPDGGLIQHPVNIKIVQDFIKNATHKCAIAWWGQFNKSDGDIDEISQEKIDSIKYLTPDEFSEIASKEQWKKKIEKIQHKLNTLSYEPDILINQSKFPTVTELQKIKPLPERGILNFIGPCGSGKSTLINPPKSISDMGLKQLWFSQGKDIISIVPRIALGREQAYQWDITWIGDMGVEKVSIPLMAENTREMGLCFNSIKKLKNKDFSNAIVIWDESELSISDLVTASTIKEQRSLILSIIENKIKEALSNDGLVVLMDAHLTDVSVDYFKSLYPDAPVFTIVNEAKPEPWDIDFYTGKSPAAVLDQMYDDIKNGLKVIFSTDNQEKAEAIHRDLVKKFPDKIGDRVDRTFTETQEGKDYIENLNQSILDRKPDYLIHTSSMGTGCSVDGKIKGKNGKDDIFSQDVYDYFGKVYGIFFGIVPSNQIRQNLARYRKPVPRVIWCVERGYSDESLKSFDPDVIKRTIFKNKKMSSEIIDFAVSLAKESLPDNSSPTDFYKAVGELIGKDGNWDNPHIDLFSKIKARNNYNLSQLSIQLRQELIDEGHNLVDYSSENGNNLTDAIKDEQQEIKREKATAIATATDITLEQAKAIKRKSTTSEGERNQVDKAYLKSELPNIDLTPDFIFDWVISDHRKALNQTKLFFYAQNPDVAKYLDNREWIARLRKFADGAAFLPDIKTYGPTVKVIQDIGYFDLIDLDNLEREYRETDEDVIEFVQKAKFNRYPIYTALGLNVTDKTYPMKLIGNIGRKLGLDFTETQKRDGEKRYRTLKLNTEILNNPTRLEILESLTCKFAEVLTLSSVESVTEHGFILNKKESSVTEFSTCNIGNFQDFPSIEKPEAAPLNTEIDPFANYEVGDRVLLWHPFNGQWQPATIKRVVSGFNGFVHALGDNGLGNSVTRHELSQLAPLETQEAA